MSSLGRDASALLAILQRESGTERWTDAVEAAPVSTVNFSEVIAKLLDARMPVDQAVSILDALGLSIVDFDRGQAVAAAQLRAPTRHLGLSLADRACLALAQARGLPALTADRAWGKLRVGFKINLVR